jgi:hypothetical protein
MTLFLRLTIGLENDKQKPMNRLEHTEIKKKQNANMISTITGMKGVHRIKLQDVLKRKGIQHFIKIVIVMHKNMGSF